MATSLVDYSYKARDSAGKMVSGVLQADSEQGAVSQLRQMQYTPVQIMRGGRPRLKAAALPQEPPPVAVRAVKLSDLLAFCINLSTMVTSGITLMGALNVLSGQLENPYFADVVRKIAQMLSEGSTFSDALEKYPKIFSRFFVNMVRVGEVSGTMNDVLLSLAALMEKQDGLKRKIQGAMIYPTILVVVGVSVILLIITFVIPQFISIFEKSGVPLPAPTQMLYHLGMAIRKYWMGMLIGAGALFVLVKNILQIPRVHDACDRWVLKVPVFGPLIGKVLVARFSRTLSSLLSAGVPLLQSLTILKEVIENAHFASIIEDVRVSAEKGEGLSAPLKKYKEFPQDVVYMLSVGEESGKIGPMLGKAANFYENKVEYSIKGLLVYIEPVFICVLGACVGVILASVLLPMFDMIKTIQR